MVLRYDKGVIDFRGLIISWLKVDEVKHFDSAQSMDEFKVWILHNGVIIRTQFYNSIMECEISRKLRKHNWMCWSDFKIMIFPKMWGGYSACKNEGEFNKERVYHLLYGMIHSIFSDGLGDYSSFKEFCSDFGYDVDSVKAREVFESCNKLKGQIESLKIPKPLEKYIEDVIVSEDDKFSKDLRKVIMESWIQDALIHGMESKD